MASKCPPHDWEVIYDDGRRVSEKCRDCKIVHSWSR